MSAGPGPGRDAAAARRAARAASVPPITYPGTLPISGRAAEVRDAIRDHPVVIVAGDTGSGKSTQLPKICLEAGRGVAGMIGHTQPRRLAARTIAERVADELGTTLGDLVGYQVRFTDQVSERTLVKLMTDGILLAEARRDRQLRRYDTIIVDEAHERSLNVDFLLGYLTRLLPRRPDLRLVITSATIDTERFARHFGAPVIEVSGRTHPVEVRWRPYGVEPDDDRDQVQAVADAVDELAGEGPGDVLVFFSGEREIHDTADHLRRNARPGTEVLPLYARLPAADQHRIFQPHQGRRVVLATNVAETSLTVPGVRYVVDTGTARISRYSRRLKVQRLPIEPVSRASADQRAGRCGRVAPGVCIRLYDADDYEARPAFTEPEILRTNLASVILQMAVLGLGEVASFPFVDPPDARAVHDGVALLEELGAFTPGRPGDDLRQRLTPLGRRLAQLPIDPRLGRMVLEADRFGCVREVLVIAAALSIQDPRERPAAQAGTADALHRRFADERSDFLAYVNLWNHLRERQRELSGNQFRRLCRAEFLHYQRVREWQDLTSQLRQATAGLGIHTDTAAAHPDHVHQALLAGLLSHVGMRDERTRDYVGARGARFALTPGSVLHRSATPWVMAGELVETSRLWARVAAPVKPEWVERLGAHLVVHAYSEPRWDRGRGSAVASERVTLYGLTLVANRRVQWARIDPEGSRDLFIRHALVGGEWDTHHAFWFENRRRAEEVRALEARARRRGLLVDDDAIGAFYAERVPAHVTSVRAFDRWWRDAQGREPGLLTIPVERLVDPTAGPVRPEGFPDAWPSPEGPLALAYVYDPEATDDGITVHVPLAVVDRLHPDEFEWLVAGRRAELFASLVRMVPRAERRALGATAAVVADLCDAVGPGDGPLAAVVASHLARRAGVAIDPAWLDRTALAPHLRMRFVVEDDDGRPLAAGRDLAALRRHVEPALRRAVAGATAGVVREGLTRWTIGTLARRVDAQRGPHTYTGWPALVDEGDTVAVRVASDPATQRRWMEAGTRRLLLLNLPAARRTLDGVLPRDTKAALAHLGIGDLATLAEDCIAAAVDTLVDAHGGPAWDEAGFEALRRAVGAGLTAALIDTGAGAGAVVTAAAGLTTRLARAYPPALADAVADIRAHLARLVHPGFVRTAGPARLRDLTRYVQALARRLDRLAEAPARDLDLQRRAQALERELDTLLATLPADRLAQAGTVGWMLEELRVSFFAQSLGTAFPVSEQRVRRALDDLRRSR